jgi:hypothetical protein
MGADEGLGERADLSCRKLIVKFAGGGLARAAMRRSLSETSIPRTDHAIHPHHFHSGVLLHE